MNEKNLGLSQEILVSTVDRSDVCPRKLPQYIAGLSASLGALAAGLVYGWTSAAGDDGANLVYPFEIDPNDFSWISSIFNVGAATVCVPIGMLTDLIGRRRAMLMLTVPFTVGWSCVIWPNSVSTLIIGRFVLGVSGGAFCVTAPMYTAEIADTETRGRLGSYFELLLCVGILSAYTLGLLRDMFLQSLISAAVPVVFFAVFFFMPETPTYHLMRGRVDAARETLIWLRGPDYDVERELAEHRDALVGAKSNKVSFLVAIRSRAAMRGLLIGYGLMFFQSFSGIDVIIFYASSIFREATGDDADWSTIVIGVVQVTSVFLFTLVIDKWGRRVLLMISGTVMCLSTLVLGVYFYWDKNGSSTDNFAWLPLLCICSFNIFVSIGFDPIPWMMIGELFSPQVKGIAGSSACLFNWLMSFVVTKFYSQVKREIGADGTFWMFSAICALGVIFVYLVVPETKNKSLEQIQLELSGYCDNDQFKRHTSDADSTKASSMKL